jgi:hypothetical protein
VRQQLIDRLDDDRKKTKEQFQEFVVKLSEQSRLIGKLETQLLALTDGSQAEAGSGGPRPEEGGQGRQSQEKAGNEATPEPVISTPIEPGSTIDEDTFPAQSTS